MTVLGKAIHLIPAERKDESKPALKEDIRSVSDNDHTTSDYLFGENISKSLKVARENYKLAQNFANIKSTPRHKSSGSSCRAGYKQRYDAEASSSYSSNTRTSLNFQGRNKTLSTSKPRNGKFKKN